MPDARMPTQHRHSSKTKANVKGFVETAVMKKRPQDPLVSVTTAIVLFAYPR